MLHSQNLSPPPIFSNWGARASPGSTYGVYEAQMPPLMANSKDGQDTSRKILLQDMTICNMEALIFYFLERITNVIFFLIGQLSKYIKYQQKDHITRNIHVKYQILALTIQMLYNKVKVFKK